MTSAAQIRYQVETVLAKRHPAALRPVARAVRPVCATGVAGIDLLLEGGLPLGAISEFTGPACSGKVSLALAFVARQTRDGQVCAWVDGADGFDPESAKDTGVEMDRLLWVRCGAGATRPAAVPAAATRVAVARTRETGTVCGGMHPRTKAHGMATALGDWLAVPARDSVRMSGKPGTPGAVNRMLAGPAPEQTTGAGQVQVPTDRMPARRGEYALDQKSRLAAGETGAIAAENHGSLAEQAEAYARVAPRCAETQQGLAKPRRASVTVMPAPAAPLLRVSRQSKEPSDAARRPSPWDRMDKLIQTTDLLLQGSGFSCIVMDLSGVDAHYAHRIPLATWFRFRAAADRTRTVLLVLTSHPCTGSSGEVMLRMRAGTPEGTSAMTGVPVRIERVRQRFTGQPGSRGMENIVSMRKPPQTVTEVEWLAAAASGRAAGVLA